MACTPQLAAIAADACPVKPGLKTVLALGIVGTDITAVGAATDYVVSSITYASGKGFAKINCSRRESEQNTVPNENGGYTTTVKYFVPRQEAAKSKILTTINGVEALIAITQDQNAEQTIIGAVDHPIRATIEATKNPRNGYILTLIWEEHGDLPLHFSGNPTYV